MHTLVLLTRSFLYGNSSKPYSHIDAILMMNPPLADDPCGAFPVPPSSLHRSMLPLFVSDSCCILFHITLPKAMSSRGRANIDPQGGQSYSAAAMSLVFHTASPLVPTFRADVRYLEVSICEFRVHDSGLRLGLAGIPLSRDVLAQVRGESLMGACA